MYTNFGKLDYGLCCDGNACGIRLTLYSSQLGGSDLWVWAGIKLGSTVNLDLRVIQSGREKMGCGLLRRKDEDEDEDEGRVYLLNIIQNRHESRS